MIDLHQISKSFGSKEVVKNLSFSIEKGEKLVLLGTSGCGKTTTLKMINRLVEPTHGTIYINGNDITHQNPENLRRSIGYVIQDIGLFPHYTVSQNISLVPELLNWSKKKADQRCDELLELLDLPLSIKKRFPHELSGGQKQRIGIARAIAADPPVILLDEPFGALDPVTRQQIQKEFRELKTLQNKTMVLVTHDVFEAVTLGDKICLMDRGEIQQMGSAKELVFNPKNEFVQNFFNGQRFQLELQVITLRDVLEVKDNEIYSEKLAANETQGSENVITLHEDTSLLHALDTVEKAKGKNTLIEIKSKVNQTKQVGIKLSRQQILSSFYDVKQNWMQQQNN